MKIVITTEVLQKEGLTLQDFGILLYYIGGETKDICPEISEKLWRKNLLTKELLGYSFNTPIMSTIEGWFAESNTVNNEMDRFMALADKLRALYPSGRKEGTSYMWKDNTVTIAKKLKTLCDKFQVTFTDEEAINATKRYIAQFNGNYSYMQLLKYFILKRDNDKMEETSQLISFMQNEDACVSNDIGELI